MEKKLVCDVCRKEVKKNEGYMLTTAEVIKLPGYWDVVAQGGVVYDKDRLDAGVDANTEAVNYIKGVVEHYASMKSGWLICEDCMKTVMKGIDPALPKDLAQEFWETGVEPFLIQIAPAPDEMGIANAIELAVKSFQPHSKFPKIPLFFDKRAYLVDKLMR